MPRKTTKPAPTPTTALTTPNPTPHPLPRKGEGRPQAGRGRFNALKHGLLAQELVITTGPVTESQAELTSLHAQFRRDFAPVGIAEELLVERLLVTYWRLR